MKIIKLNKEAKKLIHDGFNEACNLVKLSLGPSGRNAIISRPYQFAEITNDGKTIAEAIEIEDEIKQLGADKVKEITISTFDKAFDGTTTATTLAQSIENVGYEKINIDNAFTNENIDPIKVKEEIDIACEKVIKELYKISKKISTDEDIYNVAMSSVKVPKYAKMIADIYKKIGKDGIITVEDSYFDTDFEIIDGFEIEAGFENELFANQEDKTFVIEKPLVLITNQPLNFKEQITPITQKLFKENNIRDIIIISDNFSKEVIQSFILAKVSNTFNIIPIKTPYFGDSNKMKDLAISLGAYLFDKQLNVDLSTAIMENMGTAKKIVIEKDRTVIFGAKGNVSERLKELNKELSKSKTKFDKDQLEKRIAKLNGAIGVIRVSSTESDKTYLKKKINNAINTTKFALQEGIVKGGGLALKEISEKLPKSILTEALLSPYNTIQSNTGGIEITPNVIDAVKTTKTALQTACNLSGLLLTIEVAIADKYEKPKDYKED